MTPFMEILNSWQTKQGILFLFIFFYFLRCSNCKLNRRQKEKYNKMQFFEQPPTENQSHRRTPQAAAGTTTFTQFPASLCLCFRRSQMRPGHPSSILWECDALCIHTNVQGFALLGWTAAPVPLNSFCNSNFACKNKTNEKTKEKKKLWNKTHPLTTSLWN